MTVERAVKARRATKTPPTESVNGRAAEASPSDGDALSAEGRPLRSYRGWDDEAGVFVQDDPRNRPRFLRAGGPREPRPGHQRPPK